MAGSLPDKSYVPISTEKDLHSFLVAAQSHLASLPPVPANVTLLTLTTNSIPHLHFVVVPTPSPATHTRPPVWHWHTTPPPPILGPIHSLSMMRGDDGNSRAEAAVVAGERSSARERAREWADELWMWLRPNLQECGSRLAFLACVVFFMGVTRVALGYSFFPNLLVMVITAISPRPAQPEPAHQPPAAKTHVNVPPSDHATSARSPSVDGVSRGELSPLQRENDALKREVSALYHRRAAKVRWDIADFEKSLRGLPAGSALEQTTSLSGLDPFTLSVYPKYGEETDEDRRSAMLIIDVPSQVQPGGVRSSGSPSGYASRPVTINRVGLDIHIGLLPAVQLKFSPQSGPFVYKFDFKSALAMDRYASPADRWTLVASDEVIPDHLCPNLRNIFDVADLDECLTACGKQQRCTAVNYSPSFLDLTLKPPSRRALCVLRGCSMDTLRALSAPITSPGDEHKKAGGLSRARGKFKLSAMGGFEVWSKYAFHTDDLRIDVAVSTINGHKPSVFVSDELESREGPLWSGDTVVLGKQGEEEEE
ncbi:unnamed protein product [Vitrella brassicaformis CCMP3155]|uniref:Uncharacterized protein n=2 Tax=Vitrella brassicaformis TaxID=1169539 RepID=A0A0G4EWR7_VITBC|nr:unnamed protein product [Vitrella brassicaformis CCMP3155]|eukprot:CEM03198.1 unnamed protein product [Vitrella brassicaformis CCMP3155]